MKNYDDLQRFKDKTRTGDIHFKDLSAQNKQASNSGWAIINQLAGVDNDAALAKAGSVTVPVPQAVKPGELDAAFTSLPKAPVAEPGGSTAPSLFDQLKPEPTVQETPVAAAPSLFNQLPPQTPVKETPAAPPSAFPSAPAIAPVAESVFTYDEAVSAPKPTEPVRFDRLFATKNAGRASHPVKDLPLQPLLEKIASCR